MIELTKEQRHEAYNYALLKLREHSGYKYFYICPQLTEWFYNNMVLIMTYENIIDMFPELLRYKPKNIYNIKKNIWFNDITPSGKGARTRVLNKCIIETV